MGQVPGLFFACVHIPRVVCEILGLGVIWSCGGDGGDVFSVCCLFVGSVVLLLGLCFCVLWELLVLVGRVVSKKRVMVWSVVTVLISEEGRVVCGTGGGASAGALIFWSFFM